MAAAAGFWLYLQLYPSGYPVALAVLGAGALSGMWLAGRDGAGRVIWALAAVLAAGHFGWGGPVLAAVLIGLGVRSAVPGLVPAAGLLVVVVGGMVWLHVDLWQDALGRLGAYAGLASPAPEPGWQLPDLQGAIRETGGVPAAELLARAGGHWALALPGLAGLLWALVRWPALAAFLPLALVGLAGYWLGHRFTLYAVPVVGLGLGLGLALALERFEVRPLARGLSHAVLAAGLLGVLGWQVLQFSARPAVEPGHARALAALGERAVPEARVWAWWDFGYAAQHFAGLPTLADGGSTTPERLFALGQVHGSDDPQKAARVMKLAARSRANAGRAPAEWSDYYGPRPLAPLTGLDAARAQAGLTGPEADGAPDFLPPEYLVVSWQTLRRAEWVSRFGRWRLDRGDRGHGQSMTLRPPVDLDRQRGVLQTREGPVPLATLDILAGGERFHRSWNRDGGAHAVVNNDNGEGVLLDRALYDMMAVQMLIADPAQFGAHFELVADEFPAARVYRAR